MAIANWIIIHEGGVLLISDARLNQEGERVGTNNICRPAILDQAALDQSQRSEHRHFCELYRAIGVRDFKLDVCGRHGANAISKYHSISTWKVKVTDGIGLQKDVFDDDPAQAISFKAF